MTNNATTRVDTRRFRLRYRAEKSYQKDQFWANMFNIWHMFRWWYPNCSLREFSEYFGLPLSTVSRRFSRGVTWAMSGEISGSLYQSSLINKTLDTLAAKNDWHTIRLLWVFESARLVITKKQFCAKYGIAYNTARPHLAQNALDSMLHVAHFHRYVYRESKGGWFHPINETSRHKGLMVRVLVDFRENWKMY
ncbi:Transposase [Vibrio tubiashii]|uniref:Uncharacterized protein n=1 Tax=Vibrio tubiashii ATCC 19109 TaxID=1051646 RepID=F9T4E4_9VIBR|nr:hypothetical protein IX91_03800 [Vibrio tubiashii ATCC 19109]EGU56055.1 hypothetical protein VITU9109_08842 [Vibrio tubiashii ATCC 19109]EIF04466.1 hypothetical protein VT1337_08346 [Vibrio tubiashii NCIMB 1337 = ATCC 19106]